MGRARFRKHMSGFHDVPAPEEATQTDSDESSTYSVSDATSSAFSDTSSEGSDFSDDTPRPRVNRDGIRFPILRRQNTIYHHHDPDYVPEDEDDVPGAPGSAGGDRFMS